MKILRKSMILILAAVILAAFVQQASAQGLPGAPAPGLASAPGQAKKLPILFGTTGACKSVDQGGPCTQQSTLVQLNPQTGALIKTIGPVGFTVNGLAWDRTSGNLYASTPPGDLSFHGLIRINTKTGKGKPVDKNAVNFGLPGDPSPIHSITIDVFGHMVAWYDEFPPRPGSLILTSGSIKPPASRLSLLTPESTRLRMGSRSVSSTSCGISTAPVLRTVLLLKPLTSSIPSMEQRFSPRSCLRPRRRRLAISIQGPTSTMGLTSCPSTLRLSSWWSIPSKEQ